MAQILAGSGSKAKKGVLTLTSNPFVDNGLAVIGAM